MDSLKFPFKWVNSDRQLADGLTKVSASWKLQAFQQNPKVRLVYDPDFTAAKKTKSKASIPTGTAVKVETGEKDERLQSEPPKTTFIHKPRKSRVTPSRKKI